MPIVAHMLTLILAHATVAPVAPAADECGTARTAACTDAGTEWHAERISVHFPDDLASDWRVTRIKPCDADGELQCVTATHPTASGASPTAVFSFVFEGDDIALAFVDGARLF